MSAAKDNNHQIAENILSAFSHYGFRKTSMESISQAAGLSRQTIYKRFGSKEACYEWAMHSYLESRYTRMFDALSKDEQPPSYTLRYVFDLFIGDAIDVINNPHGMEVLGDVLKTTRCSNDDWLLRFRARLADYLQRHNLASGNNADRKAFVLIYAGKGLLLEETSREQFLNDMTVIIDSFLQQDF